MPHGLHLDFLGKSETIGLSNSIVELINSIVELVFLPGSDTEQWLYHKLGSFVMIARPQNDS